MVQGKQAKTESPMLRMCYVMAVIVGLAGSASALSTLEINELYNEAKSTTDKEIAKNAIQQLSDVIGSGEFTNLAQVRIGHLYIHLNQKDSAAAVFERLIESDPQSADGHLGLGLVKMDLRNRPRGSISHLQAAVAADSTRADAHYALARAYLRTTKTTKGRKSADQAIRHNAKYAPPYLLLAKLYQREHKVEAAHAFYKNYLEQNPDDQTAAHAFAVELVKQKKYKEAEELAVRLGGTSGLPILAQTLINDRDYEGALMAFQSYIGGLSSEEQGLYEDISLVGLPREIRAYQSTTPETRERFLRHFWLAKDPFKTSGGAMRRVEHYRRVWHARAFYGTKKFPYDRRGEVYIRYGEPDFRSNWMELNAQMPLNVQRIQEKMAYQLYGNASLPLTFVGPVYPIRSMQVSETSLENTDAGTSSQPLATIDETLIGLERYKPITSGADWSSVPWEVWIYADIDSGIEIAFTDEFGSSMFDFAPIPTPSASDIAEVNMQRQGPMRTLLNQINVHSPAARISRIASKEPERYSFTMLEPLDFYYEALSFRGEDGKIDLQVNVALPIDKVARREDVDTTVIVERRIALLDSRMGKMHKQKHALAVPVSDHNLGRSLLAMDKSDMLVTPGTYQLAVEAWRKHTDMLQVYQQTLELPDYHAPGLMLSDIQIAQNIVESQAASNSKFLRGKWDILPAPSRTFNSGSPVYVYFEIYNLIRDTYGNTRYEVAYEVTSKSVDDTTPRTFFPRIRKDGETIEIRYEQVGTENWVSDFVELDLGNAEPGRYSLRMVVNDLNADQAISRDGIFRISGSKK